jgi:hypothetical protein
MRKILVAMLGIAWVLGSTPGFAQGAEGFGRGAVTRDPGLFAPVAPTVPTYQSRIPAPLPPPAEPPVINGPAPETPSNGL